MILYFGDLSIKTAKAVLTQTRLLPERNKNEKGEYAMQERTLAEYHHTEIRATA